MGESFLSPYRGKLPVSDHVIILYGIPQGALPSVGDFPAGKSRCVSLSPQPSSQRGNGSVCEGWRVRECVLTRGAVNITDAPVCPPPREHGHAAGNQGYDIWRVGHSDVT